MREMVKNSKLCVSIENFCNNDTLTHKKAHILCIQTQIYSTSRFEVSKCANRTQCLNAKYIRAPIAAIEFMVARDVCGIRVYLNGKDWF